MSVFYGQSAQIKPIGDRFYPVPVWLFVLGIFSGLLCLSPVTFSQDTPVRSLTLQEAIDRSLRLHPELDGYRYRLKSAEGFVTPAAIGTRPEISLAVEDALGSGQFAAIDNAQSTLSLSWILDDALVARRVQSFRSKTSVAEIENEIKHYDIAANTAHDFLTVLAFQERLALVKKAHQHAQALLNNIVNRVNAGKSPVADQLRAEVNLERRALEVEDIYHELKTSKQALAAQWGEKKADFVEVAGSLIINQALMPYADLTQSIGSNPQVRYFLTQQRVAESEIALAKAEAKNRWRLNAGIRRYERTEDYGFTVGVSLPLGKASRNQGRISALTADRGRYRADAQAKEVQLTTRLYTLYEQLKHSHHVSDALEYKIIPRLEQALSETKKAYSSGKYSYLEWSALQQELLDSRLALVDARLVAQSNTIEIERLTGLKLPPKVNAAGTGALMINNSGEEN